MSEKRVDRRILRTKKSIRKSLTTLLQKKHLEEITVQDITETADINRGTFYLHYRDKLDVWYQTKAEVLADIEALRVEHPHSKELLLSQRERIEPLPFMTALCRYIQSNAPFMRVLLGPKGSTSFQKELKETLRNHMYRHLAQYMGEEGWIVPTPYLSAYVTSAQVGVIQHWLETGLKESPEEVSKIISSILFRDPFMWKK